MEIGRNEVFPKIIARAWKEEAFSARLKKEPKEVFKEYGVDFSEEMNVEALPEDRSYLYFVLPQKPTDAV